MTPDDEVAKERLEALERQRAFLQRQLEAELALFQATERRRGGLRLIQFLLTLIPLAGLIVAAVVLRDTQVTGALVSAAAGLVGIVFALISELHMTSRGRRRYQVLTPNLERLAVALKDERAAVRSGGLLDLESHRVQVPSE